MALEDLYTVPSSTSTVISSIVVANRSGSTEAYSIAIRTNGDPIDNKHYIAYNIPLAANDSLALTIGVTLGQNDVVSVLDSSGGNLSFNLFGSEIS